MSKIDDYWLLSNMQPWEEKEAEIDGLIEIFRDACKKDYLMTSRSLGAGISALEDFILALIDEYEESHFCSTRCVKGWKKALKDAVVGDN